MDDVITSAQAAARLAAEHLPAGVPVLVVGGMGLRVAVRERGFRPVTTAADHPAAVIQGYAPDLSYSLLAEGGLAVAAGALFIASNADSTLPTPARPAARQRIPHPGDRHRHRAVRRSIAGKPEPPLHAEAVARSGARHPLVVGDRLDTDIESAVRSGADSLLVLTGVTRPLDVVLAPARHRPTYLAEGLAGLLGPHPEVTVAGGTFACGGWHATVDGGQATVTGSGAAIDGLRALCAAAWSAGEVSEQAVAAALPRLGLPGPLS